MDRNDISERDFNLAMNALSSYMGVCSLAGTFDSDHFQDLADRVKDIAARLDLKSQEYYRQKFFTAPFHPPTPPTTFGEDNDKEKP